MNSAQFAQSSVNDTPAVGRLGYISVLKESVAPISNNLLSNAFSVVLVDVGDDNRCAFACKQEGCRTTDTGCGARDESNLASESISSA